MADPVQTPSNSAAPMGDGATPGGQPAPVAPIATFSADQYNGMKGNYEHQLAKSRAAADEFKGKSDALDSQLKAVQAELEGFKSKAAQAETLATKVAELEAQTKAAASQNSKMATLMKFPALLDANGLELVKNLALEGEALEKVLAGFAAKITNAAPAANLGATPPQPPATTVTSQSLRDEAMALMRQGKSAEGTAKLLEAARLQDKVHGANVPPVDKINNQPPAGPPAS